MLQNLRAKGEFISSSRIDTMFEHVGLKHKGMY